jgi:hypothetical protein
MPAAIAEIRSVNFETTTLSTEAVNAVIFSANACTAFS